MTTLNTRPRTAPKPAPPHAPGPPDANRLDALLSVLIDEHRTLLALAHDHRDALGHADARRLQSVVEQTGQVLQRIHAVEAERRRLVARPDGRPNTIDELLEVVDQADRHRLSDRAATLRELIHTVQREHETVRAASEALATHMKGLMQQVASKLSHAGTYGRAGRVVPVGTVVSGVDIGA
jgi:chromosome segregation ATPase